MTHRDARALDQLAELAARLVLSVPFLVIVGVAAAIGIWRLG